MPPLRRHVARAALALSLVAPPLAAQAPAAGAAPSPYAALLEAHWQWRLRESPVLATTMGVRTHDRALGDLSLAAMDRQAREAADFLARFERLDTTRLAPAERVTRALLRRELTEEVEGNRFGQRAVLFTTYHGWHTGFANLPDSHPFREPADYEAYVARLAAFPRYNRGAIETTRRPSPAASHSRAPRSPTTRAPSAA
jgi:uncharacterized protein (DUF885 family)